MSVEVRVEAPAELTALIKRLDTLDRTLAQAKAVKAFAPALSRGLVETSGASGGFARGWVVSLAPSGQGLQIRNIFGKARYVEFPTKPHIILPKRGSRMHAAAKAIQKLFNPKKKTLPNALPKGRKALKKSKKLKPKHPGVAGILAWRRNGKAAFSAYKVNKSTKAGAFIFAKEVHHPGTKGKFVFKRTMKQMAGQLFDGLIKELKAAIKG